MMQCLVHLVRMASLECTQNFELNLENFPSNVGKICQDKRMITVEQMGTEEGLLGLMQGLKRFNQIKKLPDTET